MQRFKKYFMIVYSFVFACFDVSANIDNFEIGYHISIIVWCISFDTVINIGNFLYAFNYSHEVLPKIWRFVFPILILHIAVMGYLDSTVPQDVKHESTVFTIAAFVLYVFFLLPTLWANYKLGYGKRTAFKKA